MKKEFSILSSDGIHTLQGVVYQPQGEIKGFFHIVHGMDDYIDRYGPIMEAAAGEGCLCFGYDHLGHGKTARSADELGYFAPKQGFDLLCRDVKLFSDAVRDAWDPERKLPYYLMGHSMGSFITRLAVERYVKPDKYIIMGTSGSNPIAGMGLAACIAVKALKGQRHRSPLLQNLAFGSYSERFGGGTPEDPSPWLTRDEAVRQKYYADPLCTFLFTASAMEDLVRLNRDCNRPQWYEKLPKDLPILLLSGDMDPVGAYGKGVTQVWEDLRKTGHDARLILYPDARHEILNDTTFDQVKADIFAFLES